MLEKLDIAVMYGLNSEKWLVSALELGIDWNIAVCLASVRDSAHKGCRYYL